MSTDTVFAEWHLRLALEHLQQLHVLRHRPRAEHHRQRVSFSIYLSLLSSQLTTPRSIGSYPYNMVNNYGSAIVNSTSLSCQAMGGVSVCMQGMFTVIQAPITMSSGKRK
jgi:hypothetical protein